MIKSSIKKIERAVTVVMAFLFAATLWFSFNAMAESGQVEPKPISHEIYFTLPDKHGFPRKEESDRFGCSDKIYAVANLTSWPIGKHSITFVWIDPSGTDRERVEYDFHVRKDETRLWSWISLKRATGAGMLQWLNPAAGLEEFIGEWEVKVYVDNKAIELKSFEVIC